MTTAAERFIDAVEISWDHRACWEDTAAEGLSEVDENALRSFCGQSGDDYGAAEAEVMEYVRAKVA